MRGFFLFVFIFSSWGLLYSSSSSADAVVGGTEILPKGVRAAFYQKRGYNINGAFNQGGNLSPFAFVAPIQIQSVLGRSPELSRLAEGLNQDDRKLIREATLAELYFNPQVKLNVDIYGFAWGITNNLMLGFGFPVIDAKVELRGRLESKGQTIKDLASALRARAKNKDTAVERRDRLETIASALDSVPEIQGSHVQFYLTDTLGYKPLGDWQAQGIGDAHIFLHYNFINLSRYRQGARFAITLPTGRKDDPDIINDFAFGNETLSAFIESRHDIQLIPRRLIYSISALYEKSLPTDRTVRVTNAEAYISEEKIKTRYERGDMFDARTGLGITILRGLDLSYHKVWHYQERDKYPEAPDVRLNENRSSEADVLTLSYSSVPAYFSKDLPLPARIALAHYETTAGKRSEKLDYTFLELQMYF